MKSNTKKIAALGAAGLVLTSGIGAAIGYFVADDTKQVEALQSLIAAKQAEIAELEAQEPQVVIETVTEQVEVEVPVEVEVLVDNENLNLVLQYMFDNEGNVSYVTNELDEEDINEIVDRIVFLNDVENISLNAAETELLDLVDRERVSGVRIYKEDISRIRLNDPVVDVSDLKYGDADVTVTGTFRADGRNYEFEILVEVTDKEVNEVELISVNEI